MKLKLAVKGKTFYLNPLSTKNTKKSFNSRSHKDFAERERQHRIRLSEVFKLRL